MKHWRIHREGSALRFELGRLWLIRCAPGHPNRWMIVWRRGLPEWDRESHGRLKAARAVTPEEQKIKDEEYAAEARATAEREAAADPAQAARLRAIDRLLQSRGLSRDVRQI